MKYSQLVQKQKRYKYSANVCFDMKNDDRLLGFIPNRATVEILAEYLYGIIENVDNVHSRILTGSYGTGKSHLLTVIALILSHANTDGDGFEKFIEAIRKYDQELAAFIENYVANEKPYLVVPVYSDFDSFDQCISYSLKKELANQGIDIYFDNYFVEAQKLLQTWENQEDSLKRLKEVCDEKDLDLEIIKTYLSSFDSAVEPMFSLLFSGMSYGASFVSGFGNLVENLNKANQAINQSHKGIVFIFDEFGRYLEDEGEGLKIKPIQTFAEYCDHGDYNNHILLVSHKVLSLYTEKMRKDLSEEWKKIEGRFKATSIDSKYDQCLSLIPSIIPKTDNWERFSEEYEEQLKALSDIAWRFKGFTLPDEADEDPFIGGFPLNPIALFALDKLSKKVAQNERTFFTYLASDDKNSLFEQLEALDTDEFHFIGLDALFDYFEPNIRGYRSPEVAEVYKKYQMAKVKIGNTGEDSIEHRLLKAMTVIAIIADMDTLSAEADTLAYVIDAPDNLVHTAINNLVDLKVVRLMRQYGYYDFLDGSIYDFDSLIEEQEKLVADDAAINVLNESFRDFVVYPHAHNQKYHMKRIFIPVFVKSEDLTKKSILRILPDYYDGMLAFVVDQDFDKNFYLTANNLPERCICIINWDAKEILSEVKRYIAIQFLYSKKAEFAEKDPTAETELMVYLSEQKIIVRDLLTKWRNLKSEKLAILVQDRFDDKIKTVMQLSDVASEMMDSVFSDTFIVNNELINKNNVSGAIKQSREKVLEYIIEEDDFVSACAKLSPEHSIIRAVLSKNGLCEEVDISEAELNPKAKKSADIVLKKNLKKCVKAQRSFRELYDVLKQPPYGMRDGYISVLIANALREYENVSIYFHDIEKDYSAENLLEALRQPDEYSLYICDWNQEQKDFIVGLEKLFEAYINKSSKNRLKELHYAMNRHYTGIPKSARTTEKYVSNNTKKYREIMSFSYSDYNAFFFETLFSLGADYDEILQVITNAKIELEDVKNRQVMAVKGIVGNVLKMTSPQDLWVSFKDVYLKEWQCKRHKLLDYQITAMFDAIEITSVDADDEVWVNQIAKAMTGFEVEYWNDEKELELQECLVKVVKKINNTTLSNTTAESEIRLVIESSDEQKIAQFNNQELSTVSQMMLKKMRSTIDSFGQALSPEEKMQVLAKLLSEIM